MKKMLSNAVVYCSLIFAAFGFLQSCKETTKAPVPDNKEEQITTVKLEFYDTANGQILNYYFRDFDINGTNPPSQWDTIRLAANSTYTANLRLLNESDPNSIINVTGEILSEEKSHIICYSTTTMAVIIRTDTDGQFPVGIATKWFTGLTSTGNLKLTLKHQDGIKDGKCEPGTIDIEVSFPCIIK